MTRSLSIAIVLPLCAVSLSACASADWMPSFLRADPPLRQATIVGRSAAAPHLGPVYANLPAPSLAVAKARICSAASQKRTDRER